jgi:hypothetical protein
VTAPAVAADEVRPATSSATQTPTPQAAPLEVTPAVKDVAPVDPPKVVTASVVAPVPSPEPVTKAAVPTAPPPSPAPEQKNVLVVQGEDPNKPADFVYVVMGKEPAVLFKKQRADTAEGTRIDVASGTSKRIALTKDELLRVEQGHGILQMFYQGRKVTAASFDGGVWLSFVPKARAVASGQ